ncbi:MAG: LysR family transcriptional regulator [Pseudomonadota bacterium]
MNRWDELRTALYVHELGTVSAAAEALGVHRATVIRHIDALEEELGREMFRRHAQGYTATEACSEALIAVKQAERLFSVASGKVRGIQPVKEKSCIVVSILSSIMPILAPGIGNFLRSNPDVRVELKSTERVVQLDSGEADLVVRAGARPQEPGVLAERFTSYSIGLYATDDYLRNNGPVESIEDLDGHLVAGPAAGKQMPFAVWARRSLSAASMRLCVDNGDVAIGSVVSGMTLGLLPDFAVRNFPQLRLIYKLPEELDENLWFAIPTNGNHPELTAELVQCIRHHTLSAIAA